VAHGAAVPACGLVPLAPKMDIEVGFDMLLAAVPNEAAGAAGGLNVNTPGLLGWPSPPVLPAPPNAGVEPEALPNTFDVAGDPAGVVVPAVAPNTLGFPELNAANPPLVLVVVVDCVFPKPGPKVNLDAVDPPAGAAELVFVPNVDGSPKLNLDGAGIAGAASLLPAFVEGFVPKTGIVSLVLSPKVNGLLEGAVAIEGAPFGASDLAPVIPKVNFGTVGPGTVWGGGGGPSGVVDAFNVVDGGGPSGVVDIVGLNENVDGGVLVAAVVGAFGGGEANGPNLFSSDPPLCPCP
jgi:hypothetical protein